MVTIVRTLVFKTPYHVGWREPREVISSITILRSLAYLASNLGLSSIISDIRDGKLRSSSIMPTLPGRDGKLRLLVPAIRLPSRSKLSIKWLSLRALHEIIKVMNSQKCIPLINEVKDVNGLYEVGIICGGKVLRFKVRNNVMVCSDEVKELIFTDVIIPYREVRNRIDRITGATDLYPITGYRALTPMWLVIQCDKEGLIDKLLTILSTMGLGGLRSRGLGKFDIKNVIISNNYLDILMNGLRYDGQGYYINLGASLFSSKFIDLDRSLLELNVLEGIAGTSNTSYTLPKVLFIREGSIVYLKDDAYKHNYVIEINVPYLDHEPFIPLNTLFWRCS